MVNVVLGLNGVVVWVPIDFEDWWTGLWIGVFLLIVGVSAVFPVYLNNWVSKETAEREVMIFFRFFNNFLSRFFRYLRGWKRQEL